SDVQPGKNFEAGCEWKLNFLGKIGLDVQNAVDAETQDNAVLLRLKMDVAGALLDRKRKDIVGETHDRGVFGGRSQIHGVGFLFFCLLNFESAENLVLQLLQTLQLKFTDRLLLFSPLAFFFSSTIGFSLFLG